MNQPKFSQPVQRIAANIVDGGIFGTNDDEGLAEFGLGRFHVVHCNRIGGRMKKPAAVNRVRAGRGILPLAAASLI
jgi:hypothetical protein